MHLYIQTYFSVIYPDLDAFLLSYSPSIYIPRALILKEIYKHKIDLYLHNYYYCISAVFVI